MSNRCPCCFACIISSGGCVVCAFQTILCHCGARFCAAHHSDAAGEHVAKCGTNLVQFPPDPTLSTTVQVNHLITIGAGPWD